MIWLIVAMKLEVCNAHTLLFGVVLDVLGGRIVSFQFIINLSPVTFFMHAPSIGNKVKRI